MVTFLYTFLVERTREGRAGIKEKSPQGKNALALRRDIQEQPPDNHLFIIII